MIKKVSLFITVIFMVFITGCEKEEVNNNIMFDNKEFTYINVLSNGYTLYRLDSSELEVRLIDNKEINASYLKDDDVYLITGEVDSFVISKNGTTVLTCSGEEITCSGIENLEFKDDISNIYDALYVEPTYTFQIIGSIISLIAVLIFVMPLKLIGLIKKDSKKINVFPLRMFAVILFLVGLTIVFTL